MIRKLVGAGPASECLSAMRQEMPYSELESHLSQLVRAATPGAQRRFALDTIALLRQRAEDVIIADLSRSERAAFFTILNSIDDRPIQELATSFKSFHDGISTDEFRATEFHHELIDLFCAVDAFIGYRLHQDPKHILRIALSGVNSIDYLITMRDEPKIGYSIRDMFASPKMVEEYERQQRLLASGENDRGGPAIA